MSYTQFDGRLRMPRAPRLGILGTAPHVRRSIGLVDIGLTQSWPPTASSVLSFRHLSHWDFGPDLTPFSLSLTLCSSPHSGRLSAGARSERQETNVVRELKMLGLHEYVHTLHAELSRGQAVSE